MLNPATQSKEQLADAIVRCLDGNDLRQGLEICQKLNRSHPDYAYGWYLASYLMKKARNLRDALRTIDRALALGWSEKYQLHKARCLSDTGDIAATVAAVARLRDATFSEAYLHNDLGTLLHQMNEHEQALAHYARAIALEGARAEYRFNKAAVQRYLGDIEGAEAGFDMAIKLAPNEFEAYNARAHLRTQIPERNHVAQLRSVIARTEAPSGLTQLHYALAKELEDLGDYEQAFASLKAGADTKRRHMRYSIDTDLQIMAKIAEVYRAELFGAHKEACNSVDPIFVIGMPRTGTTLVERILDSHSLVHSAGELNNFALELMRLTRAKTGSAPVSRLDFVSFTATLDFAALGDAYLASTRAMRDESPFFIDKLPFNFLYAGLIHLALPRARIINLQRHPMDTCYAVYKQWFKDAYPFSYDLDELGQYYIAYHRLMQHWNAVMPGVIHTVRYEDLVADVEAESRRLLTYCGLPWEAQCLRYYENRKASTTASAMQVRQPIYTSSVARWRHYARQLEPLRARLESAGIDTA